MPKFDLAEVRQFNDSLIARLDFCDNDEGPEFATMEATHWEYARTCCTYCDNLREWIRAVFSGRIQLDPEVDKVWKRSGERLYARATEILSYGRVGEKECLEVPSRNALKAALWEMDRFLLNWLTPKLAVGPGARLGHKLDKATIEEGRRRLKALPPLPADWEPTNPRLKALYKKVRRGQPS